MKKGLFILIFISQTFLSVSQNRYVNWLFAKGLGLKFTSSGPSIVNGGKTNTEEGVATMSDPCGNLLFYSDGTAIWNKKHSLMTNGNGLAGNNQSAEAVLIVPLPLSDSLYYVFTTDAYGGNDGVQYSIVDISLQGKDGEVITKNIQLYGQCSEKLTAILHANKKDYWILTHDWNNSRYKVFLLTDAGLNFTPVVSVLGPVTNSSVENALGHLRPSPNGTLVASTFWYQNILEIYNFNNSTGALTLKTTLTNFDHTRPYSIEFSHDNSILYVGEAATGGNNDIYQFDVKASNIAGSRYKITTANYRFGNFGLGPDGKFYIAKFNQSYLGVITNPNTFGSGVNYVSNGFNLGSQVSMLGLPNPIFPIEIQNPEYLLSAVVGCKLNQPVLFDVLSNFCYDSLLWDLSDFSSGKNYSKQKKLSHFYPFKGNYDVTLTVYYFGKKYVSTKNIKVPADPVVNLGKDTFFCGNFSYFLDAGNAGATFLWQDNYTGKVRNAIIPGKYYVTVTSGKCFSSDTMVIKGASAIGLGRDTSLCFDKTFIYTNPSSDSILWLDGAKNNPRTFSAPGGKYIANVYKNRCINTDTISILLNAFDANPLPPDTSLCEGAAINVNFSNPAVSYLWNDGSKSGVKTIDKPGFYRLIQSNTDCVVKDSLNIKIVPKISFSLNLLTDTTFCEGDTTFIMCNTNYIIEKIDGINTGITRPIGLQKFFRSGTYFLKAENMCFKDSTNFKVKFDSCRELQIIFPEIFSPNGDMLNDEFKPVILGDANNIIEYDFRIYTRWGEQIFKSTKSNNGWHGDYMRKDCQLENYLWTCFVRYNNRSELKVEQQKGIIMLIR